MSNVYRVIKACPICEGDVKGAPEILFYCKPCNLRFRLEHLNLEEHEKALTDVQRDALS
ncbi:MAG: hypothetical protein ABIA93_04600 [Candidatus Woesearchaeota archaeon]